MIWCIVVYWRHEVKLEGPSSDRGEAVKPSRDERAVHRSENIEENCESVRSRAPLCHT